MFVTPASAMLLLRQGKHLVGHVEAEWRGRSGRRAWPKAARRCRHPSQGRARARPRAAPPRRSGCHSRARPSRPHRAARRARALSTARSRRPLTCNRRVWARRVRPSLIGHSALCTTSWIVCSVIGVLLSPACAISTIANIDQLLIYSSRMTKSTDPDVLLLQAAADPIGCACCASCPRSGRYVRCDFRRMRPSANLPSRTTCAYCARPAGSRPNDAARGSGTHCEPKRSSASRAWRCDRARRHGERAARSAAAGRRSPISPRAPEPASSGLTSGAPRPTLAGAWTCPRRWRRARALPAPPRPRR